MATQSNPYITPAEYVALERKSPVKHEYFAGEMFAMAGGTEEHNLMAWNVGGELRNQFKGRPCRAYVADMRVKIGDSKLYTYPDVVAVCGESQFEDDVKDTLLNPILIVEVLSESTEAYDRGKKFEHYRKIPSFKEYLLIAQDHYHLERYAKQEDGEWLLSEREGLATSIELPSIGCTLALAEVYDKLQLTEEP